MILEILMDFLIGLPWLVVFLCRLPATQNAIIFACKQHRVLDSTPYGQHLKHISPSGLGIGQSKQKYQYLPEANSDSIFAIVGEETGFLGTTALLGCFTFVIWKGFQIAQNAPDNFGGDRNKAEMEFRRAVDVLEKSPKTHPSS